MGEDASVSAELDCEEKVEVVNASSSLNVGHKGVLDIRRKMGNEGQGVGRLW